MDQTKKFTWADESEEELSESEEPFEVKIEPTISKEKAIEKHPYSKLAYKIKETKPPYTFKLTNINYNASEKWEIYDFLGLRFSEAKLELLTSRNRFNGIVIATAYSQAIGIKIAKRHDEEFRGRRVKISLEENGCKISEPDKFIAPNPKPLIRSKIEASENNRTENQKIEIIKDRKIVIAPDRSRQENVEHPESIRKGEKVAVKMHSLNTGQNMQTEYKRNPFGNARPIDRLEKDLRFDQEHLLVTSSTDSSLSHPRDEKLEYQIYPENSSKITMHDNKTKNIDFFDKNKESNGNNSKSTEENNESNNALKENKKPKANPFGSAKPVDTLSKDIEFEKTIIERASHAQEKNLHSFKHSAFHTRKNDPDQKVHLQGKSKPIKEFTHNN
ncbi:unnamed protein product [Blepharisma stoltei]|uniref:RRM domain-containing protein n=1 Tax=Blepharisma stoltei TaxID=1481888 RepID=A0AAU9K5I6_9CILI|nr:unnamed protein product [Blepharisma stoltei]